MIYVEMRMYTLSVYVLTDNKQYEPYSMCAIAILTKYVTKCLVFYAQC